MRKKYLCLQTILGFIFLLGGLLIYGLGVNNLLPVPRPDLVVWGTSLVGIIFIVSGSCDLLIKKTKQQEIEEKDERNIAIANKAMATAYQVMTYLFVVALFILIFMGYMNEISCFTMLGALFIAQIVFALRLLYLQKKM